jgi:hypothetical protein
MECPQFWQKRDPTGTWPPHTEHVCIWVLISLHLHKIGLAENNYAKPASKVARLATELQPNTLGKPEETKTQRTQRTLKD